MGLFDFFEGDVGFDVGYVWQVQQVCYYEFGEGGQVGGYDVQDIIVFVCDGEIFGYFWYCFYGFFEEFVLGFVLVVQGYGGECGYVQIDYGWVQYGGVVFDDMGFFQLLYVVVDL